MLSRPMPLLLEPAEWHVARAEGSRDIDDDSAHLESVSDLQRIVNVLREDTGLQTVGRAVGDLDRIIGVL